MEITQNLRWALNEYKKGNNQAFTYVYEESKRYIYACIYKIFSGNENGYYDISDVMNETYLEVCHKVYQLQDDEKFLSWAGTIASRKCLEYLRKNNRFYLNYEEEELENIFESEEIIPENVLVDKEKQRILREIIDTKLTDIQKLCLISYYYNEQKQSEIADNLGIPENTVKTHLSRAKKIIKENIILEEQTSGTRFYGLSPVLLMLLSEELMYTNVPEELSYSIMGAIGGTLVGVGMGTKEFARGMMTDGNTYSGVGGYVSGNQAGAVGGYVQAGSQTGAVGGTVTGSQVAVASGKAATGALGRVIASSMKAKIIVAALGTAAVATTGVLVYNATHDKEDTTQEITTEIITEDITESIVIDTTETMTTEAITEEVTEEVATEIVLTENEEAAVIYMVHCLTGGQGGEDLTDKELLPSDELAWEFISGAAAFYNYDYFKQGYDGDYIFGLKPNLMGVQATWCVTYDDVKSYSERVFGISEPSVSAAHGFSDTEPYVVPGYRYDELTKAVIYETVLEEDVYVISGNISIQGYMLTGEMLDDGQYDFELKLIKDENSPTGFKFVSIKYEAPSQASNNDGTVEDNAAELINNDIYTATSIHTTIQTALADRDAFEELTNYPTVFVSFSEEGLSIYSDRTKELLVNTLGTAEPAISYTENGAYGYAFNVDSNGNVSVYISGNGNQTEWLIYYKGSTEDMDEEYAKYYN